MDGIDIVDGVSGYEGWGYSEEENFKRADSSIGSEKRYSYDAEYSSLDQRVQATFVSNTEVGMRGGAKVEWGGKEGPQFSGNLSGYARDNERFIEFQVEQKSDGKGSAAVSGGLNTERQSKPT
jgi:hypothetical protein